MDREFQLIPHEVGHHLEGIAALNRMIESNVFIDEDVVSNTFLSIVVT